MLLKYIYLFICLLIYVYVYVSVEAPMEAKGRLTRVFSFHPMGAKFTTHKTSKRL